MITKETLDVLESHCRSYPMDGVTCDPKDVLQLITAARELSHSQELVQQFQIDVNSARNALSLANQAMVGKLAELESSQSQIETHIQTELEQRKKIDQLRLGISDKRNELESVKAELNALRDHPASVGWETQSQAFKIDVKTASGWRPTNPSKIGTLGEAIDAAKKSPTEPEPIRSSIH